MKPTVIAGKSIARLLIGYGLCIAGALWPAAGLAEAAEDSALARPWDVESPQTPSLPEILEEWEETARSLGLSVEEFLGRLKEWGDTIPRYGVPEMLPDGTIIIPRRFDPDGPGAPGEDQADI